nr:immunoglobulin heavy chain junction region [Macaca mulatta]MOX58827.1 immunoglobulin heavy chain junction region [Macaca mulatta]MOX58942.1 immunoglobulin heavy chain junction region [Macaca mulatta]MOX58991.1 immunoglobulin heavy chain junction region [Macaca mulatta]MOX59390.1 immunoglobulin heavy chain junction region [Macaca mulatta]
CARDEDPSIFDYW